MGMRLKYNLPASWLESEGGGGGEAKETTVQLKSNLLCG